MKITFNPTKEHILFIPETAKESGSLNKFPGLVKIQEPTVPGFIVSSAPAIGPIAYNLVKRFQAYLKNVNLSNEVAEFINKPFKLNPLPTSFKYHTKPVDFQDIALRYLFTLGSAGLLLDPGMGKSKIVLDYIFLKGFNKSIIVCPFPLLFVWEDEIAAHRPELSYYIVRSTDWDQEKDNIRKAQVIIINYNKAVIFKNRLKEISAEFLHLDEFLIKDVSTERTKALTELRSYIPFKCGGSGTLINNTPLDAYAPIRFLQPALVGGNYRVFFDRYTVLKPSKTRTDSAGNPRMVVVNYRGTDEIRSMLESCCIVMTKEHWLKLPPKVFEDIQVQASSEQKDAYYSLLKNYRAVVQGEEIELDNALVLLSKLYQISQGFLYINDKNEEDNAEEISALLPETEKAPKNKKVAKGKRRTVFFQEQPKIEALKALILGKLSGRRALIWFNMHAEFELISKLLDELKLEYISIKGGDKNIGDKVRQFNQSKKIPFLLCQSKSVNYGITVLGHKSAQTVKNKRALVEDEGDVETDFEQAYKEHVPVLDTQVYTQIFYSLNFSLEVFIQQQNRIHRLGQDKTCEYYRIFTNTPVERRLRQVIEDKIILSRTMLLDVATTLLDNLEN